MLYNDKQQAIILDWARVYEDGTLLTDALRDISYQTANDLSEWERQWEEDEDLCEGEFDWGGQKEMNAQLWIKERAEIFIANLRRQSDSDNEKALGTLLDFIMNETNTNKVRRFWLCGVFEKVSSSAFENNKFRDFEERLCLVVDSV